jgi:hypothetical protein
VTVAQVPSPESESLPEVSGRYVLYEDEAQFIPNFPFERDLKYRVIFDPRPLGFPLVQESLKLEFLIPSDQKTAAPEVTQIFPSSDLLPENLLRFYVCFTNSMQRGRALEEISLLDSDGRPVADAFYRPPLELWDRTMLHLTVLLDPGRLKRWVGPNVELGPPLKVGQEYILEIGSGMKDSRGRSLRGRSRKHFVVGNPARERIAVEDWKVLPPLAGSRRPLVLRFPAPLDWALLFRMIAIESADGTAVEGKVTVDQCETRWNFTPASPWTAGMYHGRIRSELEDVCGNSIIWAFDRPLRKEPHLGAQTSESSLMFQVM